MKMTAKLALALALIASLCMTAYAGTRNDYYLTVDRTNHYASGAMGSVRRDTVNTTGFIGCTLVSGFAKKGDLWVQCQAGDATGTVMCASDVSTTIASSGLVKAVQGITSNGYLYFGWDPNVAPTGYHACTQIEEVTGSLMYPIVR